MEELKNKPKNFPLVVIYVKPNLPILEIDSHIELKYSSNLFTSENSIDIIEKTFSVAIDSFSTKTKRNLKTFQYLEKYFLMDIIDFKVVYAGDIEETDDPSGINGPVLKGVLDGHSIIIRIFIGQMDPWVKRKTASIYDNKEYYKEAVIFAENIFEERLKKLGHNCLGVHLLFDQESKSFSQFATTSITSSYITRLYSIVLPKDDVSPDIEFAIFCDYSGPLKEFYKNSYKLDQMALSIEWK